ncbi:hypothetical protein H5181_02460 [Shewanella sp. SG44-2]|uniref:hypothetical protein n=1 Tax=Shewanella sp. SG44-2 TaxID=2760962 RepID=UPI0015FF5CC4|nr:hypothetical protein [Shewanella sp. SG44-2]MBB1425319.1 hypothetical protein [Shewanella sp. SG44-2]|tara:strand:- start:3023 stop:3235 length:213 start_codon:yes stop_codon:yes gene_type:complete
MCDNSYTEVVEDTIDGFDIYIEPNPDQYRGGYIWSVSKNNEELDTGLVFSIDNAFEDIFDNINSNQNSSL